jgi:WD40 repeat protein
VDISSTKPVVLKGARSPAAFSPEGSMIVSAYLDHTLQLWGTKDAKAIGKSLVGHEKGITAIAFSPTGSRLISASDDCTIRIWSSTSESGELLLLQAYTDIQLICMSSDESRIICVSRDNIVQTLNANTGIAISQPSRSIWNWAEFSPGGSEITRISTDGQSRSTECQTGQITEHSPADSAQRITEGIFSPDKTRFISISKHDFIDFSEGTNSCESSSTSSPSLTFSSDGRWLMSVILEDDYSESYDYSQYPTYYRACMWDSRSGQLVWEDLSYSHIPSVAISPSGNMAVTWTDSVCNVRDTLLGTIISRWDTQSVPKSVAFSQDEKHINCILDASGTAEKWDIESSALLDSPEGIGAAAALGPGMSRTVIYVSLES